MTGTGHNVRGQKSFNSTNFFRVEPSETKLKKENSVNSKMSFTITSRDQWMMPLVSGIMTGTSHKARDHRPMSDITSEVKWWH